MRTALNSEAKRLITEALEMTRGVRVVEIISTHSASSGLEGRGTAHIKVDGWAPTLHAYQHSWQVEFEMLGNADEQSYHILNDLKMENAVNVLGEHEGKKAGILEPVDHKASDGIDHLRVDRHAVALLSRDGASAKDALRKLVIDMLNTPELNTIGGILRGDDGHAVGTTLYPYVEIGEGMYNGAALSVPDQLPETVMGAIAGRRLGEVVANLPAEIADRVITSAERDRTGSVLRVEPDFMDVRDIQT